MKRKSYTGRVFGRLTVTGDAPDPRPGRRYLRCVCECGVTKAIYLGSLTTGVTASCGCLRAEMTSERRKKHGLSRSPTYNSWMGMKARCLKRACQAYKNYGGRGITVCDRWMSFENFLADMGECPPGMSIERLRNEDGYEPGNCEWATDKEQANNKRSNRVFELDGEQKTISQIAELKGLDYWFLRARLVVLRWPLERAINEPSRQRRC